MKSCTALVLALLLAACTPTSDGDVSRRMTRADSTLPPVKLFATGRHAGPVRANTDLALDFIELSFKLESGRELPVFTRFEGPITVRVSGAPPGQYRHRTFFAGRDVIFLNSYRTCARGGRVDPDILGV